MTDDLLVKFLLGESTPEENNQVEKWMVANKGNALYFAQIKLIWDKSKQLEAISTVDENEAWKRFKVKVGNTEQKVGVVRSFHNRYWLRIAALLFIIAGGSWLGIALWKSSGYNSPLVQIATLQNVLTDTLPDGSIVTLNKKSGLSYPKKFNGRQRNITLTGEAFFNVTPDRKKPFIITVNDVTVKVLGTSFNVKSRNNKTEVIVETGIVEVSRNNTKVRLQKKEKVTVPQSGTGFIKENATDKLYNHFRTKEFVCDRTPLWKVVEVLGEAYNTTIVIERKALQNEPLTTTFNNESLDRILDIIAQTFEATIVRKDNKVIIK